MSESPPSLPAMSPPHPQSPPDREQGACLLASIQEALVKREESLLLPLLSCLRLQVSADAQALCTAAKAASVAACVLRCSPAQRPQVVVEACQLVEDLHGSCSSCSARERGGVFYEAVQAVMDVLGQEDESGLVHSAAARVLLKCCGCTRCWSVHDWAAQSKLGEMGAVESLVSLISRLHDRCAAQEPSDVIEQTIADAVQALFFLCLENEGNQAVLLANKGLQTLQNCIQSNATQKLAQEHSCMILGGLACSGHVLKEDALDCISSIATAGRLQPHGKCTGAAASAVCSLTLIGSCAVQSHAQNNLSTMRAGLAHAWAMVKDRVEHVIVELMHSCRQKDDQLLHHCLRYIFVVGNKYKPFVDRSSVLSSALPFLFHHVLLGVEDTRVQGATLRAICALLESPQCTAVEILTQGGLGKVLCTMRKACRSREASSIDVFHLEVYGLVVLLRLLNCMQNSSMGMKTVSSKTAVISQLQSHIPDIHAAVLCIAQHLTEASKTLKLNLFVVDNKEQAEKTAVWCYEALRNTSALQEPCKEEDLLLAIEASAVCLNMCGEGVVNVADSNGFTILHGLAQLGHSKCLAAYISAGAQHISFNATTNLGLNALQLARAGKHVECVSIIEKCMNIAMRRGEVVLPPHERLIEDYGWKQYLEAPDRKTTKNKTNSHSSGNSPGIEVSKIPHAEICESETEKLGCRNNSDHVHTSKEKWGHMILPTQCMFLENQEDKHGFTRPISQVGNKGQNPNAEPAKQIEGRILQRQPLSFESADSSSQSYFCKESRRLSYGESWQYECYNQSPPLHRDCAKDCWVRCSNSPQDGPLDISTRSTEAPMRNSTSSSLNNGSSETIVVLTPQGTYGAAEIPKISTQVLSPSGAVQFPELWKHSNCLKDQMENSALSSMARDEPEEHADEYHMRRWLSSEISGLIDNIPDEAGDMDSARDPLGCIPMEKSECQGGSGFHTPQGIGYKQRKWQKDGCVLTDTPCSPLHLDSVAGNSSNIQYSSDQTLYQTPGHLPQVWFPQVVPSTEDLCSALHEASFQSWANTVAKDSQLCAEDGKGPSKHLWLGNLSTRLPRSVLKSVFEQFGPVEDVVTFPGRMYAFVNYVKCEDAQVAAQELDMKEIPALTGSRKLVVKFRPNRKALGRVGDLMPEDSTPDTANAQSVPPSQSWHGSSGFEKSQPGVLHPIQMPLMHENMRSQCTSLPESKQDSYYIPLEFSQDNHEASVQRTQSSKHLWIGNVCLRPNKTVLFNLFSRYGPVESVRTFSGKTFAFVNFQHAVHAAQAKECLDGELVSAISGAKALVVRFQRDGSGPPTWFKVNDRKELFKDNSAGVPCSSHDEADSVPNLQRSDKLVAPEDCFSDMSLADCRFPKTTSKLKAESFEEAPGLNLANRLNPNNAHYDSQLALKYKRMGKGDKEALWASQQACDSQVDEGYSCDLDDPPSYRSTAEADSIGRLTRTLSAAAARGKASVAPPPLRSISLGSSRASLLDENRYLHMTPSLLELSSSERQKIACMTTGHQRAISLPKFPTQLRSSEQQQHKLRLSLDISSSCGAMEIPVPEFQRSVPGGLGQFEKNSLALDPFPSGQAIGPHILSGNSCGFPGKTSSLLPQISRDTIYHFYQ